MLLELKRDIFIMIIRSIHREDKTILNTYTPNNRAEKCMKQKLTEIMGEINNLIIIVGNFSSFSNR